MKSRKTVVVLISSLLLSACGGGGGSSSGSGVADKNVTRCIKAEKITTGGPLNDSRYTNTCDFAVSLAYKHIATARGPFTLQPNGVRTDTFGSVVNGGFIACRLPSQATNRGGSNFDVELDCT